MSRRGQSRQVRGHRGRPSQQLLGPEGLIPSSWPQALLGPFSPPFLPPIQLGVLSQRAGGCGLPGLGSQIDILDILGP